MSTTPHLALPLIAAAQAQKHVTHNEALVALDALLHLAVLDKDLSTPPGSPGEGERYIVGASPTGAWTGRAGQIAARQDGAWRFFAPQAGHLAFVVDEAMLYVHGGAGWSPLTAALSALQNLALLGIGTTADGANPFSAKLNRALWTARTAAEGGDGDLRVALNKETAADTLSLLLQTGFSGRFELGLLGEDRLSAKVSLDGATWRTALSLDLASGGIDVLAAETAVSSAAACDLGAASSLAVAVTGATTITSFGLKAHALRLLRFSGALTLTHNATTLALPGGASIVTAAGDTCLATSDAAGAWRVRAYQRASGKATAPPVSSEIGDATATGRSLLTAANAAAAAAAAGLGPSAGVAFGAVSLGTTIGANASAGHLVLYDQGDVHQNYGFGIAGSRLNYNTGTGGWHVWSSAGSELLALEPSGTLRPWADNAQTLGKASARWSVLYAGTGAINTSDAGQKAVRGALSAAELRAWARVEPAVFRWLDAIARKGEEGARLHAGFVAQDVGAAFAAEGLDAGRYGLFCSDPATATVRKTRPVERQRMELAPVEASTVVVNAAGEPERRLSNRLERRPVFTEVELDGERHRAPVLEIVDEEYEIEEPTGKRRLGLRPDQCLAFEAAFARRRLDALEARVAALESP